MTPSERMESKEAFHHQHLYPYIDYVLTSKEKYESLPDILQSKSLFWTDSPKEVVQKLFTAKVLYLYPDSFDQWTDILLEIQQRKQLPVKLFLLCDSDISFCLDHLEILFAFFPEAHFWIQNWLGYHPQATLLPIGTFNYLQFPEVIEKKTNVVISYVNHYIGCEARDMFKTFLDSHPELEPYYLHKVSFQDYVKFMGMSVYHTCPMGEGPDTFRFWESLVLGTIPIVKDDDFYDFVQYYYPDVPMLRLSSWEELLEKIETLETQTLPPMPYLEKDYWVSKIKTFREVE